MRLEMNCFDVKKAEFGPMTAFSDGVLTIDRDELIGRLSLDPRISSVDIALVHPGESVRIANVLEVTEARIKADADHYYPGMHGPLYRAGDGRTNVLRGASIFEMHAVEGLSGGLVDMAGAGARLTPYSRTVNICLLAEPAPGVALADYCRALKHAALTTSVYLAKTTKGMDADEVEVFDLERSPASLTGLPRVAYLMQLHSHGEMREPFVYGGNARSYYPTVLHPNEVLDGAIVCGHYNISTALKNTTYTLLNHPVIRGLFRRHGSELDFRGLVVSPEPTSLTEITRASMLASGLLKDILHADGVIVTKEGGGHTDVDLMENCSACERLGIKAVLIDNEWLGPDGAGEFPLLAGSPDADAMVSVGNADALVRLPSMDRVVGGNRLMGGFNQDLAGEITLPIWFIPNAISQAGFTYLSTEVI
jgi:sarcosine reductase